ncbi:MAG: alpha/beta fold hydrolase [Nocardioidaceae bacterium]|nr:alpha/beta fold hydrolase [Nocardioidaceae bacterium]
MTHRLVTSADGTRLAVFEAGDPDGPTVLAIHGFPDNHTVWDGVAAILGETNRFVSYDVRGAGASDKPRGRRPYLQEHLTADLVAVLDAIAPDERVHLVAHDWGSMQTWASLARPEIAERVASYTSISGPSLDHAALWLRGRGHARATARQLLASTYMAAFQLPVLPELAARAGVIDRGASRVGGHDVRRGPADTTHGINLYRANVLSSLLRPQPPRIGVPTLVLVPDQDPYSSPPVASQAPVGHVDDLTVEHIEGGHWVVSQHPARVAGPAAAFIEKHGQKNA